MKRNTKSTRLALAIVVSLLGAANAWGQYGLYESPTTATYATQQASPPTQQTVIYPATQQQPFQPLANRGTILVSATGPSLIAPANQAAPAATATQEYIQPAPAQATPQPQTQYAQTTPAYPQTTTATPANAVYQPSTTPAYPSYSSTPTASYQANPAYATQQPYAAQPLTPQYQATTTPQPMYSMPTSPRFGSPQATAPAPQLPRINPVTPQQLAPATVQPSSFGTMTPQPIAQPTSLYNDAACCDTPCCESEACCDDTCCEPCCEPCCPWYVSVSALGLGRDQANRIWTSYQANREANQIMNTQDIDMSWAAGGEITFGRTFCCETCNQCGTCDPCGTSAMSSAMYGVEVTYWQLAKVTGHASITNPYGVSTPLDMRYIEVGPAGSTELMSNLFDNAIEHRLRRSNEAYNVELNALYYGQPGQSFCGHTVNWLIGARFLKFNDDLLFSSLESGTWDPSNGINQGYLADNIENNLVGFQMGFQTRSPQWYRLSTFFSTKFGIYNNHIKNDFQLYRGDGYVAQVQPASGVTGTYPVRSTANVFSTIAEINLGIEWNISQNLSAGVGYRIIAISGIGLADHQIPDYIVDIPEIDRIDCNGDLLLHGAFVNLNYGF